MKRNWQSGGSLKDDKRVHDIYNERVNATKEHRQAKEMAPLIF